MWFDDDDINYTITEPEGVTSSTSKIKSSYKVSLFAFDPNRASQEDLQRLGIEEFLAKRIVNYRSKGGHFSTKKDLLKIYDFPKGLYDTLYSYILLPDSLHSHSYSKIIPFDINTCDTSKLIALKGIGSTLASRIVDYRTILGGFVTTAQVLEVYGIEPETGKQILPYLFIKKNFEPKKIAINQSTVEELSAHPYLNKKEAHVLVNYRNEHDAYQSIGDLSKVRIFTDEQLKKLTPYLEFK